MPSGVTPETFEISQNDWRRSFSPRMPERRTVQIGAIAYIAGTAGFSPPNVETPMFVIHTRVLDEKAAVVSAEAGAHFEQRQDAERHLDRLVEQSQPNSGRDSSRCMWWTQNNKIVTVYTISP